MTLRLVTPPSARAVSLAEAKAHLRIDSEVDEYDALILAYIDAATDRLGYLNRTIAPSTWALDLPEFADEITLPRPPFNSLTHIRYRDAQNVEQTLSGSVYEVVADSLGHGVVRRAYNQSWPSTRGTGEPITITWQAGYVTAPGAIRAAILLMVGALWDFRSENAASSLAMLPFGVDALVSTYRIWTA